MNTVTCVIKVADEFQRGDVEKHWGIDLFFWTRALTPARAEVTS